MSKGPFVRRRLNNVNILPRLSRKKTKPSGKDLLRSNLKRVSSKEKTRKPNSSSPNIQILKKTMRNNLIMQWS